MVFNLLRKISQIFKGLNCQNIGSPFRICYSLEERTNVRSLKRKNLEKTFISKKIYEFVGAVGGEEKEKSKINMTGGICSPS